MYALELRFNPESFRLYLEELHKHLFGAETINGLINQSTDSHRVRRFLTMWILQDKDTFEFYFQRQVEFGLKHVFDQAIAGLTQIEGQLVEDMRDMLAVTADMGDEVDSYSIKEFKKDLCNYSFWYRKREQLL